MNKKLIAITAILMTAMFASSVLADTTTGTSSIVQCKSDSDCIHTTLNLCTKDTTTYKCDGKANATLTFDQTGNPNSWSLTTNGLNSLQTSSQWALIYYLDQPNEAWDGGAGGIVLTTFGPGDVTGFTFAPPAGVLILPLTTDWNAGTIAPFADYCLNHDGKGDNYAHCTGAKIWVVPTTDLTQGPPLSLPTAWDPTKYLLETDLIKYSKGSTPSCNGGTHQCDLTPKLCGMTATGNVDFGQIIPGATVSGVGTTTVANTGIGSITPTISGADWVGSNTVNTMPVGATSWSTTGAAPWNTLGYTPGTSIGPISPAGTATVSYKLTVPSPQPTDTYTQTITFTAGC